MLILLLLLLPTKEIIIERQPTIVTAIVSAYTASQDETDSDPRIAANNKEIFDGLIACPSRISFGTEIEIKGKTYTCGDRMNKRYRDKEYYDIIVENKEIALQFGRQTLEIKIFE